MATRLTRDEAWRLTGAALLVAALVLRNAPLALLGAGLLGAALSVVLWQRLALQAVEYRRSLGEPGRVSDERATGRGVQLRAFFGEEVPLVVEIANRKLLPLPWLEADDSLPAGLEVVDQPVAPERSTGRAVLHQLVSLRWYERVRLRYRLVCQARGAYFLGPVRLSSGDPFGFTAREDQLPLYDRLLVYPKVLPLEALGLPSRHPLGDTPDPRRLFMDATRAAGVRPYATGDSPRHIHWKASARLQQLQTRLYEPTASHTLMVYVNLASFEGYWWASLNRDLLELAIVTAASVGAWGLEQGYHVGVTTNGAAAGGEELAVAPAGDPQQLVRVLELLARVSQFARTPLEEMLARDRTRLPWGTTVVVVSAVIPEGVLRALLALRGAGHAPVVLRIGGAGALAPGVLGYHIAETLPWQSLPALAIGRSVDRGGVKSLARRPTQPSHPLTS